MSTSPRNALQAVAPNAQVTSSSSSAAKGMDAHTRLWSDVVRSQQRPSYANNKGRMASTPAKPQVPLHDIENEGPLHQDGFSTLTPQQKSGLVVGVPAATSQAPDAEPRRCSAQQRPYISNSHGGGFELTYLRLSRETEEELANTLPRIPDVGLNEIRAFHHFTLYPFRLSFRPGERMPLRYGCDLRTVIAKHFGAREQDLHLEVIHTHHRQPLLDHELLHDLKGNRPQLQVTFLIQPVLVKDLSDSPCPRCVEISRRLRLEAQLDRCPDPVREEELRRHCAAHPIDWYPQARPYEGRSDPRGAMGFNEHCIVPTKPDEDGRARFRRDPYNCANFVSRTQDGVWTATRWPTANLAAMLPPVVVMTDDAGSDAPAAALQSPADSHVDYDGDSGESVSHQQQPRIEDGALEAAGPTAAAVPESFSEARLSTPASSSAARVATLSTVDEEPLLPTVQEAPAHLTVEGADVAEEDPACEASMSDGQTETLAAQLVPLNQHCDCSGTGSDGPEHPDTSSTASTTTSPSRQLPPQPMLCPATREVGVALDTANKRPAEKRPSAERDSSSSSLRVSPAAAANGGKASTQTARPHEPKANSSAPQLQSLHLVGKARPTAPVASKSKSKPASKNKRTVDPDEAILRAAEQQRAAAERASKARNLPTREPRRDEHDLSDEESRNFTEQLNVKQFTVVAKLKNDEACDNQKITDEDVRRRRATARSEGTMPDEEKEVDYGEAANDEIKRVRELLDRIGCHATSGHLVNKDRGLNLCREAMACERSFIQRTGTPTSAVPPFHVLNFCCKVTALVLAARGFAPALSLRPAERLPLNNAKIAIELRAVYLRAVDDHHHPALTFRHALALHPLGLTTMLFQMRVAATNRLDFPERFWDEASNCVDSCTLRTIIPQEVPRRLADFLTVPAIYPVTEVMAAMLWDALVLNDDLESCLFRLAAWHEPITKLANFLHLDSVLVIMAPILAVICEGLVDSDTDEAKGVLLKTCREHTANCPCDATTLTALRLQECRDDVQRFLQPTLHMVQLWNALHLAWRDAQQRLPAVTRAALASA